MSLSEKINELTVKIEAIYHYCTTGVWSDSRDTWKVNAVKIVNLSVRNFLDKDLQDKACNLTYRTVLAAVPTLAMLFAVGRGFGFQNLMQGELARIFPAQRQALETASQFVDNYLEHASQGIFVGIGLVFLFWTLISLMGNVEKSFNEVWSVREGRSFSRKVIDYTAFFIILPVLIVCSAGIQVFMSHTVQSVLDTTIISPFVMQLLDYTPLVLSWLTFSLAFKLIPHTQVHLKYALISGVIFGTVFYGQELLFVSGQVFVSSYNAIYGSFAFILLLLVWLQLSWLIVLIGVTLNCALQNKDHFDLDSSETMQSLSKEYLDELNAASQAIIAKMQLRHQAKSGKPEEDTSPEQDS